MRKKVFLFLLYLLGRSMVSVCANTPCAQEIILTESIAVPMDDVDKGEEEGVPNPTRFRATISGHELFISANTNKTAHVIVENNNTGDIIEEKTFTSSIPLHISQKGDYTLYIISDDTAFVGEFAVEQ